MQNLENVLHIEAKSLKTEGSTSSPTDAVLSPLKISNAKKRKREYEELRQVHNYKRIILPATPKDRITATDLHIGKIISHSRNAAFFESRFGSKFAQFFKRKISIDMLADLESFLETYNLESPCFHQKNKRGDYYALPLGVWQEQGHPTFYWTRDTSCEKGQLFIERFQPLWKLLSDLVRRNFPTIADTIEKTIPKSARLFDLFTFAFVNWTPNTAFHMDDRDWRNGVCIMFTFGDYTGGELGLPEIGHNFQVQPGDVIVFPSGPHISSGKRRSVVLTIHNALFDAALFN